MTPKRQSPKPARRLVLVVRTISPKSTRGCLQLGALSWPCAIGRSGRGARKREGDGLTPVGRWQLRQVLYRADRGLPPRVALPLRIIRQNDGWCDESTDRNYNRSVRQPYPASAEKLSRDDRLYDVVVILGYNEMPRLRGRGSAIFMHLAHGDDRATHYKPTAGCIALSARDLRLVLARLRRGARVLVPA